MFCGLFNFDQNHCIRTSAAWPFFCFIFWNVESTIPIVLKHSKCCSFMKTNILKKKKNFGGLFNFDQNSRIRTSAAWPFFCLIFWNVENTLPILLKHSKFCSYMKTISLKGKKRQVLGTFQLSAKSLYPDLSGMAIFLLDLLKFENTLPIVLKHSKCCSFMKTNSLKKKKQFLGTFQFWPKSLYPDLTDVAIFFCWFFWLIF